MIAGNVCWHAGLDLEFVSAALWEKLLAELCCTADDLKISGSVDGLSKILYTRGSCDMRQVLHTSSCTNWSTSSRIVA